MQIREIAAAFRLCWVYTAFMLFTKFVLCDVVYCDSLCIRAFWSCMDETIVRRYVCRTLQFTVTALRTRCTALLLLSVTFVGSFLESQIRKVKVEKKIRVGTGVLERTSSTSFILAYEGRLRVLVKNSCLIGWGSAEDWGTSNLLSAPNSFVSYLLFVLVY